MTIVIKIDDKILKSLQRFFSRKKTIFLLVVVVMIVSIFAYAEDIRVPHIFRSGDVISAEQINENFRIIQERLNRVARDVSGVPIGTIVAFGGPESCIPDGWLFCDGDVLSSSEYEDLYNAIGTRWGGDGNTFRIPDLRGRFLRGLDKSGIIDRDAHLRSALYPGGSFSNEVGSYQNDAFQGHLHESGGSYLGGTSHNGGVSVESGGPNLAILGFNFNPNISDGKNGPPRVAGETRPVNAAVNYIIRAK
ncbi:MAG TPA: phage tail protein [Spirochaetota bacterium]|nr:phage tail protein [Spirochaetota bacterium]